MSDVRRRPFNEGELETLCKILGDTNFGLTGSQIAYFLNVVGVEDVNPDYTKWKRLYNALGQAQYQNQAGNIVLEFISRALQPARYINDIDLYKTMLEQLNMVLSFHGLEFRDDGNFHKVRRVSTLTEAEQRASKISFIADYIRTY